MGTETRDRPLASAAPRAAAMVLYPACVWICLRTLEQRTALGVIALMLVPLVVWSAVRARSLRLSIIAQGAAVLGILGTAWAVNQPLLLRAVPPLIGLSFTLNFLVSILRGRPIIESFARLQKPVLPAEEVAYCRRATWFWVGVLAANTTMVAAAAFLREMWQWFVVAAPASYVLMGLAFAAEYTYRRYRFREFDPRRPWDRILCRLMGGP